MSGRGRGDRGEPRRRSRMDLAGHVVVITEWLIAAFCLKDFEYIESPTLSTQQEARKT